MKSVYVLLVVSVLCFTVAGCSALDTFFGVDSSGVDKPGASPAEGVGSIGGLVHPAIPAVLGTMTTIWAGLRGKKYKDTLLAAINGIESLAPEQAERVKSNLKHKFIEYGVKDVVDKILKEEGLLNKSARPEPPAPA